ncbi:MAG: LysE family transporter [Cloacibacterium sp.]|nr:LysE family transporter [Cloacibacterium sp.]
MLELIFSAIGLGLMLSLVFIGPVFFLLVETSLSRGPRHALALDFGVITADVLCILAAYFSSQDIIHIIDEYPSFYRITAFIVFLYGIFMMISKTKMHLPGEQRIISQNYWKTFLNGFLLNILNIGVVIFWLVTVISIRKNYPETGKFLLYISLVIGTYLFIDLVKIYLAKQFHDKLNQRLANQIRKGVGIILLIFSIFIFLQSFKKFNQLDRKLEQNGINKEKINEEINP